MLSTRIRGRVIYCSRLSNNPVRAGTSGGVAVGSDGPTRVMFSDRFGGAGGEHQEDPRVADSRLRSFGVVERNWVSAAPAALLVRPHYPTDVIRTSRLTMRRRRRAFWLEFPFQVSTGERSGKRFRSASPIVRQPGGFVTTTQMVVFVEDIDFIGFSRVRIVLVILDRWFQIGRGESAFPTGLTTVAVSGATWCRLPTSSADDSGCRPLRPLDDPKFVDGVSIEICLRRVR